MLKALSASLIVLIAGSGDAGNWSPSFRPPDAGADRAKAIAIPLIDVEAECRAKNFSPVGYADCIRVEQAGYDFTKAVWDDIAESGRRYCSKMSANAPYRYAWMRACLFAELQRQGVKADQARPPRFRY